MSCKEASLKSIHGLIYLFDMCIIKVHPSSDLCLKEEGGVMFSIVAHHANQVELWLPGLLLRHPVKQLQRQNVKSIYCHFYHMWGMQRETKVHYCNNPLCVQKKLKLNKNNTEVNKQYNEMTLNQNSLYTLMTLMIIIVIVLATDLLLILEMHWLTGEEPRMSNFRVIGPDWQITSPSFQLMHHTYMTYTQEKRQ